MTKAEKQREYKVWIELFRSRLKVWFELYRSVLEKEHNDQGHDEGTESDCPECFPTEEHRARVLRRLGE